ncbi:flavin-containing monooxygenase [Aspergillus stella-maris]|uniref:flavin-containing monooxygenase n=1 Tax=Aspergillus stella-maris TaxID=1810926 RepID=UPI003CCDCB7F
MATEVVDLLIVGAGLHGLIMAKTYLEVHPFANLLVVDESNTVGGTWAAERLYPGLKTNNVWGSYELSDFPMVPEKYGVKATAGKWQDHIPGKVVHEYLCDVANHFGIDRFLRLETKVINAEQDEDRIWNVELQLGNGDEVGPKKTETVRSTRLVLATGLTSKPHIPSFPGSQTFGRPIIHSKQLLSHAEQLSKANRVVVMGGNKSAWDVAYTAARSGSQVDMVIRPSGGGPSYVWPRRFSLTLLGFTFATSLAKLSTTRLFTLFDPAPFGKLPWPLSWIKRALHRTRLGQFLVRLFWTHLDSTIRRINSYTSHPGLRKLEPWTMPFWMGNSLSIHNYESSWFDLVREGKIGVHIGDVEGLEEGVVRLRNENGEREMVGVRLEADALVLCTGWGVEFPVKFETVQGCPERNEEKDEEDDDEILKEISKDIPYLLTLPRRTPNAPLPQNTTSEKKSSTMPLLYHDILPTHPSFLQNRNLTIIGMSVSIHAILVAQAQALWITAFFEGRIPHLHPDSIAMEEVKKRALIERAHGETRRPRETGGAAGTHADLVFDSLPYVDWLLSELGLKPYKKGSLWKEMTEPYGVSDYRGLVEEWIALQSQFKTSRQNPAR